MAVVRLKSASSPRTVFEFVKQASWQTAPACGGSAKQASAKITVANVLVMFRFFISKFFLSLFLAFCDSPSGGSVLAVHSFLPKILCRVTKKMAGATLNR